MLYFRRLPIAAAIWSACAIAASAGAATAQDAATQRLDEVVVTATRTPVPIDRITSSVTVIDAETIEAKQAKTVLEVLRDVPGVDVRQSGGLGGITSVFMRGGNSSHTLVMIDGVEVNSPSGGLFDFADLTIDNVERIEVIRGPQSTLYGSDAIGGVIHIMTKRGEGPVTGYASAEYGSFDTFQERVGVSGGNETFDYALAASRLDTSGISRASAHRGNPETDAYDNTTFSGRLGAAVFGDGRIDVTTRYTAANRDIDAAFPLADDLDSASDRHSLVLAGTFAKPIAEWWDQRLQLSLHDDASDFKDRDPDSDVMSTNEIQSRRVDWQHNFHVGSATTVTVGYELDNETGENKGTFKGTIINDAGYAQVQTNPIEPLSLVVGGRFDSNSRYGDEATYKIGGSYAFERFGTTVRSSYGTGFHGPTLNDLLFVPFNNPDLEAETSEGFDAGIEQQLFDGRVVAGITYFYNDFTNLIVFDVETFVPRNINDARAQGIEATVHWAPMATLDVNATYTHTAGRDLNTDLRLPRRPLDKGNINMVYAPIAPLRLNLDVLLVGPSFDDRNNTRETPGYGVVHAAGSYDVTHNIQAFVRIDNILDQTYEEVLGFGTLGRSAFGGLKVTF